MRTTGAERSPGRLKPCGLVNSTQACTYFPAKLKIDGHAGEAVTTVSESDMVSFKWHADGDTTAACIRLLPARERDLRGRWTGTVGRRTP
jgi:hypothetical protein